MGQIRDSQVEWTGEAIQRIATENTTFKQRVLQLTTDNCTLDERLKAARSNLRFETSESTSSKSASPNRNHRPGSVRPRPVDVSAAVHTRAAAPPGTAVRGEQHG
ncbi:hypothetical protein [Streptomyces sp. R21]|uniref:hypothetical protein n=1 Tax=Streptomyces sp. R21 TaxID=3238627 RepID=UPI0034DFFE07